MTRCRRGENKKMQQGKQGTSYERNVSLKGGGGL